MIIIHYYYYPCVYCLQFRFYCHFASDNRSSRYDLFSDILYFVISFTCEYRYTIMSTRFSKRNSDGTSKHSGTKGTVGPSVAKLIWKFESMSSTTALRPFCGGPSVSKLVEKFELLSSMANSSETIGVKAGRKI